MFDQALLDRLYRYAYSLCANRADAYDLLQSSVERCLTSPPKNPKLIYSYTRSIIRNRFIDWRRHEAKFGGDEFIETEHTPIATDIASLEQLVVSRAELDKLWPKLSAEERELLFLWAVEGFSTKEISELQGKPRNTVLSTVYRLRKRFEHLTLNGSRSKERA